MFHYRLQSVLEVREQLARLKQKEFSEVLARRQALEAEITQFEQRLDQSGQFMDGVRAKGGAAFPLEIFQNFKRRVASEVERIHGQIREESQELEAKRMNLIEAKRAQRSLEILKEKQRGRYEQELRRRERALMDEVASNYQLFRKDKAEE